MMLSPEWQIFLASMTPIGEIRAAVPLGLAWHQLPWVEVYSIAVLGNLVPVLILLLWLKPLSSWLISSFPFFKRFFEWLFERTRKRYRRDIKKYGWWGLTLFVAIPLPMTGGWTGAVAAFLADIPFWKAFSAIALGVMAAGLVVTAVLKVGLAAEILLGWPVLLVLGLFIAAAWFLYKHFKHQTYKV